MRKKFLLFLYFILISFFSVSQELEELLDAEIKEEINYVSSVFKTTRLVNGHSIKNPSKKELLFIIGHNFGRLNEGAYGFFGLDQSTIRIGLDYGITNRLCIGIGRSSFQKTFDGFVKYKIVRQQKGKKIVPLSIAWVSGSSLTSLKWTNTENVNYEFKHRISYFHQLIIASKISHGISVQGSSYFIHKNLVESPKDKNNIFAFQIGGRVKINNRLSVNSEYIYSLPGQYSTESKNLFSLSLDLETGGHTFQLHFSNAFGLFESAYITQTTEDWLEGGIHFGFSIVRSFSL